jgi:hypothetical protein
MKGPLQNCPPFELFDAGAGVWSQPQGAGEPLLFMNRGIEGGMFLAPACSCKPGSCAFACALTAGCLARCTTLVAIQLSVGPPSFGRTAPPWL